MRPSVKRSLHRSVKDSMHQSTIRETQRHETSSSMHHVCVCFTQAVNGNSVTNLMAIVAQARSCSARDWPEYMLATSRLHALEALQDELQSAVRSRDLEEIQAALDAAERLGVSRTRFRWAKPCFVYVSCMFCTCSQEDVLWCCSHVWGSATRARQVVVIAKNA